MKFKDPRTVTCPVCAGKSEQRVKALLAREAVCPFCHCSFADEGERMQQSLDDWAGYVISIALQSEIEQQHPRIAFGNDYIVAEDSYHRITLKDIVASVENHLNDVPAATRKEAASCIVKRAFQAEFPAAEYPSLDAMLVPHLQNTSVPLFGRTSAT